AGPITLASGQASFGTSALSATSHTITACYSPTGIFQASNGSVTQTVNKATPTATLDVTNSPVAYNGSGQAATVGIVSSSVPGTVANILTGGAATQTNVGTYAVTADFVPDDPTNYNTLTGLSAGNFVINTATTSTAVTSSQNPSVVGGSVSFTATVSSASGTPGGTVQFVIDGVNFGAPVALSAGSGTSGS